MSKERRMRRKVCAAGKERVKAKKLQQRAEEALEAVKADPFGTCEKLGVLPTEIERMFVEWKTRNREEAKSDLLQRRKYMAENL